MVLAVEEKSVQNIFHWQKKFFALRLHAMSKNLVIVESPAKAKTIEKFLGKDYTVKSSFGHVRDLPAKEMAIDIEHGFTPTYVVNPDKTKVITELKKAAKSVDTVWLASDEDREGEAIAWHLATELKLDPKNTKRIVFHEITKPAILDAIKNPRTVDQNLVDAQQARRVLDRLVGYELSPVLWRKVRAGLSAGRVQSVALRLIVERERAIEAFVTTSSYRVDALFTLKSGETLKASLPKKLKDKAAAQKFLESLTGAQFQVSDLETKPAKRTPVAPFTTSTLQQEASRKLGFSVKQTMAVAQKLYEAGKITYMRTDSVNLSNLALAQAKEMIEREYGVKYSKIRQYKTKSASAQEAHEAIRPTDVTAKKVSSDTKEQKLYDLIWKRTVASQMADAELERTTVTLHADGVKEDFVAKGEVILFDGFLTLYRESTDDENGDDETALLPAMKVGQPLTLQSSTAKESFTRPPARFTEAMLVREMEERGIGRPSTYAPTISTIQTREYVEKSAIEAKKRDINILTWEKETVTTKKTTEQYGADKGKLIPTELGMVVNDFLVKHFEEVVDFQFTAKVEEVFDQVAEGKEQWNAMIGTFYKRFHGTVEKAQDISTDEAKQVRILGADPKSGKPISVKMGRFGPMVQMGTKDDEEKPRFASVPKGKRMDDVTLEDALKFFALPRILGTDKDGIDIKVNIGRFGPYVQRDKTYVSITQDDVWSIELTEALQKIEAKIEEAKNSLIHDFKEAKIQVLHGRYGPYIKAGKKNVRIPKGTEPESLTLEQCQDIIAKAPERKARPRKSTPK